MMMYVHEFSFRDLSGFRRPRRPSDKDYPLLPEEVELNPLPITHQSHHLSLR